MRVARRAGTIDATSATVARRATVTMNVRGRAPRCAQRVLQQPTDSECGGHAEDHARHHDPGAGLQEQPAHLRGLGAERHPDGDLLRAASDGVRHRRVEARRRRRRAPGRRSSRTATPSRPGPPSSDRGARRASSQPPARDQDRWRSQRRARPETTGADPPMPRTISVTAAGASA